MLKNIVLFTERKTDAAGRIARMLGELDIPLEAIEETVVDGRPAVVLAVLSKNYVKAKRAVMEGHGFGHASVTQRSERGSVINATFGTSREKTRLEVHFPSEIADLQKEREKRAARKEGHSPREIADAIRKRGLSSVREMKCAHILACMDPRISVSKIVGADRGQVFESKNAGNKVTENNIADIKISVGEGAKVVGVLWHSDCRAMKLAMEGYIRDVINAPEGEKRIPEKFAEALNAAKESGLAAEMETLARLRKLGRDTAGLEEAIADDLARINGGIQFGKLMADPEISRWVQEGRIMLIGGMYDIAKNAIAWS